MLKKFKKLLCILGVTGITIMLFVVSSPIASAEDIADIPEDIVTDPPVVTTVPEPVYTTAPPVVTTAPEPVYTQAPETVYTDPPVYTQATEAPNYQGNEYNNYDNGVESYSFYEEPVTEYENQEQYYDSESTSPTDNTSSLYNSDREIDDTELSKRNWKKIAKKLAQAKENEDEDSSPFDYIKNSDKATGFQAFLNNLNWAMTAAIICFILAVVCIVLFIVFTVKKKKGYAPKKGKKTKASPQSSTKHSHASSHTDEDGYYVPSSRRSNSDYGDNYGGARQEKAMKKRAKQDTAEINIPNKYKR